MAGVTEETYGGVEGAAGVTEETFGGVEGVAGITEEPFGGIMEVASVTEEVVGESASLESEVINNNSNGVKVRASNPLPLLVPAS